MAGNLGLCRPRYLLAPIWQQRVPRFAVIAKSLFLQIWRPVSNPLVKISD